jgi:hypothetical protein
VVAPPSGAPYPFGAFFDLFNSMGAPVFSVFAASPQPTETLAIPNIVANKSQRIEEILGLEDRKEIDFF